MGGPKATKRNAVPASKTQASNASILYKTAVTIVLNTVPWKQLTSAHNYCVIMHKLKQLTNARTIDFESIGWELNSNAQLHCHFTLMTKKPIIIPKIISQLKKQKWFWKYNAIHNFENYRFHFKPLNEEADYIRWSAYCKKTKNMRPLYNKLCHDISNKLFPDLDLADYDIEFINGKPKYIDPHKQHFIFC